MASETGKVIASIAPSAAPAETPSVNGVASGLRSSAWKTTPDAASAAPTSAAASVRGSRETKKICASVLSANGMLRSNTRRSEIGAEPTIGASRHAAAARSAEHQDGEEDAASQRHGRLLPPGLSGEAAPRSGGRRRRGSGRRPRRRRAPAPTRASAPASVGPAASTRPSRSSTRRWHSAGRQVQVVRGHGHRHAALGVQAAAAASRSRSGSRGRARRSARRAASGRPTAPARSR